MKKLVSLLLIFVMIMGVFSSVALAEVENGRLTIDLKADKTTFAKNESVKLSYTITNLAKATGIKTSLYIDDNCVLPENKNYVMLYTNRTGSVDFVVPADIDSNKNHSLILKVNCSDGTCFEEKLTFTVLDKDSISLQFMSYPQNLKPGEDIPLAVKVNFLAGEACSIKTFVEINGKKCDDVNLVHNISAGDVVYFTVPGKYVSDEITVCNVKITATPDIYATEGGADLQVGIPVDSGLKQAIAEVNSLVKPVIITAYVHRNSAAYAYGSLTGYRTTIPAGTYVAYLNPDNHNSMRAAKIRTQEGAIYWVPMSNISISKENYVIPDTLTSRQKEIFVNSKGYSSKTDYLVWVNLERQILSVFLGSKGNWKFVTSFPVASGKNTTPTPTVEHEIEYVTRWVTPTYTCYPVLALYDGYAIHNQPVSPRGYVTDSTIGKPASAGCVRMLQKDINWVHAYVPVKTNVVIY